MQVLVIIHQPDAGPGVFAQAMRARGVRVDSWRLPDGGSPQRSPHDYDAVMTFGGAMHPDQEGRLRWLAEEKAVLADLLDRRVPLLGVCLGAELLAEAAGGAVRRAPQPEIGWYDVELTGEGIDDPLLAPLRPRFRALGWHSYEFPVPPGAVALARSAMCLQAYRIGDCAWGIQFHAEVLADDIESWIADYSSDEDAVRMRLDAEAFRERTRTAISAWNELGQGLCQRFLQAAVAARSTRA